MKKVLASLLVVCTLLACMMISTSAENYTYLQDSVIEMDGFTKGNVNWIFFDPTDITGATKLQFDLYVGEADQFGFTTFEIGSHPGKTISDWQEKEINNSFGALNDGWNTVSIDLDSMANVAVTNPDDGTPGEFDYTKFCRIRFFNVNVEGKTTDVKFKNFTAVKADGTEIKVGAAPAPATDAPADPVVEPTTFDAASSVAVVAVAAMGVALVASKKRH